MDISIEKTNDCQAQLTATATVEEINTIKNNVIGSYMQGASVPGFRPGKAPKKVIAKRYAAQINEEAEARVKEQIQEKTLSDNPELKVLDFGAPEGAFQEDGSYSLTTSLTIVPAFELPEYKGLKISVPSTDVSDEEVEETLQGFAKANAKFEPTDEAAQMGDVAVIDFKTTVEGQATADFCGKPVGFMEGRDGHWAHLEEDTFMPGLHEGLVGLKAGESKDITITLKEDFPLPELSGKEITFSCTVTEVREKQIPEITAELFAESLPDKSLDEIKEIVRTNLVAAKERSNDEAKTDQLTELLADQLDFALPEAFVERENENTVQRKVYAAMQAGDYSVMQKMDELKESSLEETKRNLRVYFALQEIASKESVVATEREILMEIGNMAEQAKEKNFPKFFKKMQKENRITGIRLGIITTKVLDLLARNAEVTIEAKEEAPAAEAPAETEATPEA